MQQEEVDYFGHEYEVGQNIELEGNVMLLIAKFLTEVIQKETEVFAPFNYAISAQEIKNEDGMVVRVESEFKEHNRTSFMLTATSDNGAQLGISHIGVKASQILSGLLTAHAVNIENKIAKKPSDLQDKDAFKA